MNDSTSTKKGFHYGYLIVVACCAGVIPASFGVSCMGLAYSSIAEEMGVGIGLISNYGTAFMIAMAIYLPVAGRLFNKVDARIMTSIGCVAIGCGLILCSFAPNPPVFFAGAAIVGLGGTTQMGLMGPVLINRWFAKRAGFFIGLASAFMGICTAIVSPIIGNAILAVGWRTTVMTMGIVCMVLSLPFTIFVVRSYPADKGLAPFGADEVEAPGAQAGEARGLMAAEAFKTPAFILLFLFVLSLGLAMYAQSTNPSYIKQLPLSQDMPTLFSTAASALMIAQVVTKLSVGALAEKHTLATGLIVLAIGAFGFVLNVVGSGSAATIIAAACCIGAFTAIANVFNPIITRKFFGMKDYSSIYSVVTMASSIAGILQAPVLGTLLDKTNFVTLEFTLAGLAVLTAVILILAIAAGRKVEY